MDKDHVEVYDRQIRLWGAESQRLLMESTVVFYGLSSTTVEAAKNIFLSGIKIAIYDPRPIANEIPSNLKQCCFISRPNETFATVGSLIVSQLSEMNPLGTIYAIPKMEDLDWSSVQLMIVDSPVLSFNDLLALDAKASEHDTGIMFQFNNGPFSLTLSNFLDHVVEDVVGPGAEDVGKHDTTKTLKKEHLTYRSLSAIEESLHTLEKPKAWGRLTPGDLLAKVILIQKKNGCTGHEAYATLCASLHDPSTYDALAKEGYDRTGPIDSLWTIMDNHRDAVFGPVTAVVGGLICNEVRKYITKVQVPVDNAMFFSFYSCCYGIKV